MGDVNVCATAFRCVGLCAAILLSGGARAAGPDTEPGEPTPAALSGDGSVEEPDLEAAGATLELEVEAALRWNYYWRGAYVWRDALDLEPWLSVGANTDYGTFALSVWAAVPLMKRDELVDVRDEVDFTVSWSREFADVVTPTVGVVSYVVFQEGFHTEEVFFTLDVAMPVGLGLSTGLWADVNELQGLYYRVELSWSGDVAEPLSLEAKLFHGGARYAYGDYMALEGVGASLGLSVDVGAGVTLGLDGGFAFNPGATGDNGDNGEEGGGDTALWYAGFTVGYALGGE